MEATSRDENNDTLRQALVDRLKNQGVIRTLQVEEAFRAVPRHMFVPEVDWRNRAGGHTRPGRRYRQ